jgi:hypothetical protein
MPPHQTAEPSVLPLFLPPYVGQAFGRIADIVAASHDRGIKVEQGSVCVEYAGFNVS